MSERQIRMPHRHPHAPDGERAPGIDREVADAIARHSAAGVRFEAGGVESFARRHGEGPAVVLIHGLPDSSFGYRRLIPELADLGMEAIAFDLPGMGLAERPSGHEFDFGFESLVGWASEAIDALGVDRAHLVVHDIGGPLGFGIAARHPERVLSITALNVVADPARVQVPISLRPLGVRGAGEVWLRDTPRAVLAKTFYRLGVADQDAVPLAEVYAQIELLRRADRGAAFLRIVRELGLTAERMAPIAASLQAHHRPARIVWGRGDRALDRVQLDACAAILGVTDPILLDARHYPQLDRARDVAEAIADLVAPLG